MNTERNQMDRRQEEAGAPSMGQDGFSASVSGVTRRPWRMQQEEARNRAPRQEAAFAMERDEFLRQVLGESFVRLYTAGCRAEWNEYMSQVSEWEVEKYLYRT